MKEAKVDKRRLTEDNLYDTVDGNLIVRRNPLKKQKELKEKVKLSTAEYTFLQFHHLIWKWAMANNNLSSSELSILLYIMPLISFSMGEFFDAQKELGNTNANLFFNLKRKGFIVKWSSVGRKTYYVLSTKGNSLVNRMHKMYMLEEEIPMSPRRNVIVRSRKDKDVALVEMFKRFNEKIKKNEKNEQ